MASSGMTPEAKRDHEESLRSVGLNIYTPLVIFGKGKVRHIKGAASPEKRSRSVTWCNMFYQVDKLRDAVADWQAGDEKLPICGACMRTLTAVVTRDGAA